jgi:hypothetical protein
MLDEEFKDVTLQNYFQYLVNHFFKILPMAENKEESLPKYMESLQFEISGFERLYIDTRCNASIVTLLAILQALKENEDDLVVVRREVFHAISICNQLREMYVK